MEEQYPYPIAQQHWAVGPWLQRLPQGFSYNEEPLEEASGAPALGLVALRMPMTLDLRESVRSVIYQCAMSHSQTQWLKTTMNIFVLISIYLKN